MNSEILNLISLISSVASLILAGIAIWLSIVFYKLSSELNRKSIELSNKLESNVEKLENIFNRLYSDTFGMMKDTVEDMRNHIWGTKSALNIKHELKESSENKINELKEELSKGIVEIIKKVNLTDDKYDRLNRDIHNVINEAINKSQEFENDKKELRLREHIISIVSEYQNSLRRITIARIIDELEKRKIKGNNAIDELLKLKEENILQFETDVPIAKANVTLVAI